MEHAMMERKTVVDFMTLSSKKVFIMKSSLECALKSIHFSR
jgi:hypothetical protein